MFCNNIILHLFRRSLRLCLTEEGAASQASNDVRSNGVGEEQDDNEEAGRDYVDDDDLDSEPEYPFEGIVYSREETIEAFRSYYQFLTTLHLDDSDIEQPPSGGWPGMKEQLQHIPKTEEVIELLCHLPYIIPDLRAYPCAFAHAHLTNWRFGAPGYAQDMAEGEPFSHTSEWYNIDGEDGNPPVIPPYMIGLVHGPEQCPSVLLDTKHGVIWWYDCELDNRDRDPNPDPQPPADSLGPDPYFSGPEGVWIACCNFWTIKDFFEMLKDQFRRLHFIPTSRKEVESIFREPEREMDMSEIQNIYRRHGWPNAESYDKRRCLKAIQSYIDEQNPSRC